MPSRNINKPNSPNAFYHVYARGSSKQRIFIEPADYLYFINLFKRYLSRENAFDKVGVMYPHLYGQVELLAYCLMDNHFHLLLYQIDLGSMSKLMKSIMSSYCRYFNLKYKRSGSIYESRYKGSMINADAYLTHISRYIHLNPRRWLSYRYSSIGYYLRNDVEDWIVTSKVKELFNGSKEYKQFLEDYGGQKLIMDELKYELAHL